MWRYDHFAHLCECVIRLRSGQIVKFFQKVAAVAVSAVFVALMTPGASHAGSWTDGSFKLVNRGSGKCLEIRDSSTENGAPAQQWDCNGQAGIYWSVYQQDRGRFWIVNDNSGKCLEINNSSKSYGARAQQWKCGDQPGAFWEVLHLDSQYGALFVNSNSGQLLEIENSSRINGAPAQQWGAGSSATGQNWYIYGA
ncbi:RICIN domain-containing protein [Streptomyces sp. NPDC037389]|uniref:RICIN domain-containing protein n=1 Tax=Streptomyces sp. NPDC037389 TaxID=3155369 RepID=UPI0033D2BFAE